MSVQKLQVNQSGRSDFCCFTDIIFGGTLKWTPGLAAQDFWVMKSFEL